MCCPIPGARLLSVLDQDNAVAAAAAALLCGASVEQVEQRFQYLAASTPRYRQTTTEAARRLFINDAASCMPAATAALVGAMEHRFVLICGGDRQRYRPGEFDVLAEAVGANPQAALVCTMGPMAPNLEAAFRVVGFDAVVSCGVAEASATPWR